MKRTYSEMKDSGVEWIGEIPKEWGIKRLNQLVVQIKNRNTSLQENNLLSLSYGKIKRKSINSSTGLLPASFDGYNIVQTDDIVLRLTDLQNDHTSLRVGLVKEKGIITSAYITIRPFNICANYLYYHLHTYDLKKGFYGMGAGVRQGLNYPDIKRLEIILPSLSEQTAIANYLDEKCAEIDSIISETKSCIEEYKQWKSAIIFETVTKGLDPNAEMKDSGVEWIGEIPKEWEVKKLKNSFIIISGNGFPIVMQGQEQGDYPVCKASDISANNGKIIFSADNYITQKQSIAFNIIPKGSVVFPKIGEAMKKNNRALLGVDACLDNNCQGLVPLGMNKKYSLYMLSCIDMFWYDNAGTVPCINNLRFSNSYIPFPLLSEQQKIASFLDAKCSEIDEVISEKEALISDLELYKKSLIYEVVTGKVKVS